MNQSIELVWPGKREIEECVSFPFRTIERINSTSLISSWCNRLIWGNNKQVLYSLLDEFSSKVDLIYIDPPFATGTDFSYRAKVGDSSMMSDVAYRDAWRGGIASFLQMLYECLSLLSNLLSPNGTIYIHMGPEYSDPVGTLCDEIFNGSAKSSKITWKRSYPYPGNRSWTNVTDTIIYRAFGNFTFNPFYEEYDSDYESKTYSYIEEETGRRYGLSPMTARREGGYEYSLLGITKPWRFKEDVAMEMLKSGRIIQRSQGSQPQYKRYLDEMQGRLVGDLWDSIPYTTIKQAERTGYETQKPESLLERIIKASSNEGDLVLDCFVGSGTTAVVAEKLGRRWIAADIGRFAIQTTCKRLLDIPDCKSFEVQTLGSQWESSDILSKSVVNVEIISLSHNILQVKLAEFIPTIDNYMLSKLTGQPEKWSDYIDYWSVDFDYDGDVFVNLWSSYRTRQESNLNLISDSYRYRDSEVRTIAVKVVDIFGNDTSIKIDL